MDPTDIFGKVTCRKLKISTDFGRAFVQGGETSGTQQQSQEETAQEPSGNFRSMLQRLWDKLLCIETKVDLSIRENHQNAERLQNIE